METKSLPPSPGSPAARDLGCRCPVLDNAHGAGYMGQPGVFVFNCGCPVHCGDAPPPPSEAGR